MDRISTRNLKIFLIMSAALLCSSWAIPSEAGTATVTWINPTQCKDGSALGTSACAVLAKNKVEWGSCDLTAGTFTVAGSFTSTTVTTSFVKSDFLDDGSTVCFRVYAINEAGLSSSPSGVATKTFPAPVVIQKQPKIPTGVTAQ